ncbi:MAG: hypothetical protein O6948_15025 [Deltaproteobacteria bacterium]|nr:hypothetical protein [Deltaproteobacteria bacterium]
MLRQSLKDFVRIELKEKLWKPSLWEKDATALPAILIVRSQAAHAGGIRCYHTGSLFRAREIPAEFLSLWLE